MTNRAVVSLSGGMDSVTALAWAASAFDEVHAITVNYGQRHAREIESALWQAERWATRHDLVDLLFRRVGLGWGETMAREGAHIAARSVADILGWDEERIAREVAGYREYLARMHLLDADPGTGPA